jgi:sRNA-binding carbon storage regulator CsrA
MLALMRNERGQIVIVAPPSDRERVIVLTVSEIKLGTGGGEKRVRLEFEAPWEVEIDRREIFEAKRRARTQTRGRGDSETRSEKRLVAAGVGGVA